MRNADVHVFVVGAVVSNVHSRRVIGKKRLTVHGQKAPAGRIDRLSEPRLQPP